MFWSVHLEIYLHNSAGQKKSVLQMAVSYLCLKYYLLKNEEPKQRQVSVA